MVIFNMKNLFYFCTTHKRLGVMSLFVFLLVLSSCSDKQTTAEIDKQDTSQVADVSKWVEKARKLTTQYQLTSLAIDCLSYQEGEVANGKMQIVVREVHNQKCGGDPENGPRVFSFEVDIATGDFKTDRYSPSAQFESFSNLSIEDGL